MTQEEKKQSESNRVRRKIDPNSAGNILKKLSRNPLQVLKTSRMIIESGDGVKTVESNQYKFHVTQHGSSYVIRINIRSALPNSTSCNIKVLRTPMRGNKLMDKIRYQELAVVSFNENYYWITAQQTGCSVLIIDWGNRLYSMVHLRPSLVKDFTGANRLLINKGGKFISAEVKRQTLKNEMSRIVKKTSKQKRIPNRYILVQSNHACVQGYIQLIGIRNRNDLKVYMQTCSKSTMALDAKECKWTNYSKCMPWLTY